MVPSRLSLVTLGARNVQQLRAFYERLGWHSSSPGGDEFAAFPLGPVVLALYAINLAERESGRPLVPRDREEFAGVTLALNVDRREQVDEVLRSAANAGASVTSEAVDREWGGRSGHFADPEGNVWEVAWLPGATFDERGGMYWPF